MDRKRDEKKNSFRLFLLNHLIIGGYTFQLCTEQFQIVVSNQRIVVD